MNKKTPSNRWLLTDKILSVMREHKLTYQSWATRLGVSQQRLHSNIMGKYRGEEIQNLILGDLIALTGQLSTEFYKEEQ